jgi:hypothetical protein
LSLSGALLDESSINRYAKYGVIVWNIKSCKKVFEAFSSNPVWAMSADAQLAAIVEENQLFLYDISSGTKTPLGSLKDLRGTYFLPDGKSLLVTYAKGNAVFDIASGEKILDFPGNMGKWGVSYELSEDGKWLIIGNNDIHRAFSIDGQIIYPLPKDWGSYVGSGLLQIQDYIWNIEQQKKVGNLQKYGKDYGHGFVFEGKILISKKDNYAAISPQGGPFYIDILDLSTRKLLYTIEDYRDPLLLPSKDGFMATKNGKTGFFNFSSDQPSKVIDLDYVEGTTLENGNSIVWNNSGKVSLIDVTSQNVMNTASLSFNLSITPIQPLPPAWETENTYYFDAYLPIGNNANPISISHDKTVGIWQVKDKIQIFKVKDENFLRGYLDPTDILVTHGVSENAFVFKFSPDDKLVAGLFPTKIIIWNGVTGEKIQSYQPPTTLGYIYAIDFTPDGSKLLFSSSKIDGFSTSYHEDANLSIINTQDGKLLQNYRMEQEYKKSGCNISLPFVVTLDGLQVISITKNCKIGVFDIKTWAIKQEFGDPYMNANINFALSPDNRILAVAHKDILELWDVTFGKLVGQYSNPAYDVYASYQADDDWGYNYTVNFSPDARFIGTQFTGFIYSMHSITTLWGVP